MQCRFGPQEIANTLWGFAKLDILNIKMMDVLGQRSMQPDILMGFNAQEVANTVWAFAKTDVMNPNLMQVVRAPLPHPLLSVCALTLQPESARQMCNLYPLVGPGLAQLEV